MSKRKSSSKAAAYKQMLLATRRTLRRARRVMAALEEAGALNEANNIARLCQAELQVASARERSEFSELIADMVCSTLQEKQANPRVVARLRRTLRDNLELYLRGERTEDVTNALRQGLRESEDLLESSVTRLSRGRLIGLCRLLTSIAVVVIDAGKLQTVFPTTGFLLTSIIGAAMLFYAGLDQLL